MDQSCARTSHVLVLVTADRVRHSKAIIAVDGTFGMATPSQRPPLSLPKRHYDDTGISTVPTLRETDEDGNPMKQHTNAMFVTKLNYDRFAGRGYLEAEDISRSDDTV
jgi:hypothetical protein